MIKSFHDSKAEKLVLNYLNKLINTDSYLIRSHVALHDVFGELQPYKNNKLFEKFCELNGTQFFSDQKSELSHFDFVIYSKASDKPILIIEVNGTSHKKHPSKENMDLFKQFMAGKNGIPFIVLRLYESYKDNEIKDLLKVLLKPCHSRYGFPAFCTKCNALMRYTKDNENNNYTCSNPACKDDTDPSKPYTISAREIPPLLKES